MRKNSARIGLEHLEAREAPSVTPLAPQSAAFIPSQSTQARAALQTALQAHEQANVQTETQIGFAAVAPDIEFDGVATIGAIQTISEDADPSIFSADYDPETRTLSISRDDADTPMGIILTVDGGALVPSGDGTFSVPEGVRSIRVTVAGGNTMGTILTGPKAEAGSVTFDSGKHTTITIGYEQVEGDQQTNDIAFGDQNAAGSSDSMSYSFIDGDALSFPASGGGDVVDDPRDSVIDNPIDNPIDFVFADYADNADAMRDLAASNVLAREQQWDAPIVVADKEAQPKRDAQAQATVASAPAAQPARQDGIDVKREAAIKRPALGANDKAPSNETERRELSVKDMVFAGAGATYLAFTNIRRAFGKRDRKRAA
jgi:hypothetical protein